MLHHKLFMRPLLRIAGATASKVPANNPNAPLNLTAFIVVTGLGAVNTLRPTAPDSPFVISYDVQDFASPPNRAKTVRRRVQVLCPSGEIICPPNDNGVLSCSLFNGSCAFAASSDDTTRLISSTSKDEALPSFTPGSGQLSSGPVITQIR